MDGIKAIAMTRSILLAGATGHPGQALARALHEAGWRVRALVRRGDQRGMVGPRAAETVVASASDRARLEGIASGIDIVLSAMAITLRSHGASRAEPDFSTNRNLLGAALADRVEHFACVTSLGGERMRHLPMPAAKEKFVGIMSAAPVRRTVLRRNARLDDFEAPPGQATAACIVAVLRAPAEDVPSGDPAAWSRRGIAKACLRALGCPARMGTPASAKIAAAIEMLPRRTPEAMHGALTIPPTMMGRNSLGPRCGAERLQDWLAARAVAFGAPHATEVPA